MLGGQYLRESLWIVLDQHQLPALVKRYTAGDTAYPFDMHDVYRKRYGTVVEASGGSEEQPISKIW
jgi:hypothetical protein